MKKVAYRCDFCAKWFQEMVVQTGDQEPKILVPFGQWAVCEECFKQAKDHLQVAIPFRDLKK